MTRRAKVAGVIAGIAIGAATLIAVDNLTPKVVEVCVTYYEDAGQSGDHNAACAIGATNVHVANFGSLTAGLHNGCNRGLNQSSTWNDCISSGSVGLLPANTKIQWWRDINYGGGLLACYDVDGTHIFDLSGTSDLISSMRVVAGELLMCECNPELTSRGYHRVECPLSGNVTAPFEQSASHDYLRMASELVDHGAHEYASIAARAAQAEVDDPETVIGDRCLCDDCETYYTLARLRRTLG